MRKHLIIVATLVAPMLFVASPGHSNNLITGMCVCKQGTSTMNTYSETVCGPIQNLHSYCTQAKNNCVAWAVANVHCPGQILQSTAKCDVGAQC